MKTWAQRYKQCAMQVWKPYSSFSGHNQYHPETMYVAHVSKNPAGKCLLYLRILKLEQTGDKGAEIDSCFSRLYQNKELIKHKSRILTTSFC